MGYSVGGVSCVGVCYQLYADDRINKIVGLKETKKFSNWGIESMTL